MIRTSIVLLLVLTMANSRTDAQQSNAAGGVKVPPGFRVNLLADDDLVHDIYSMTIDSLGRPVVSGPGYIKILIDKDNDGVAESAKTFADGPASGAQGLYFHGRDLFCIGDEGLLRYRDQDGDDRADGPPQTFLKFKTGEEHHVHSIQRGPDDWWYLIAGNYAGIDQSYVTTDASPVKYPQAGTVFRLKPNMSGGETVAHGFRNAYDFAFNSRGDMFTFDSDDEREVSLPWYEPTRVFHVVSGSHAGWVSRSWKAPHYFADMPPVLAEFGRGSPTGVACYQHPAFGDEYFDSLFVLDWTYGRVLSLRLNPRDDLATYEVKADADRSPVFMSGADDYGFAPTDVEVAPDGSLLVCVGGRGTRGGIYRVTRIDNAPTATATTTTKSKVWPGELSSPAEKLAACLQAPQPLSSWSRAVWEELATELGADPFRAVVSSAKSNTQDRVRAIEILTAKFGGLKREELESLAKDPAPQIRARSIWSWQRTRQPAEVIAQVGPFLADPAPSVGRAASEVLLGLPGDISRPEIIDGFLKRVASKSRFDRMAAVRAIPQLSNEAFETLSSRARQLGPSANIAAGFGGLGFTPGFNEHAFQVGLPILLSDHNQELKLEAIRLMQFGLGDVAPIGRVPAAFDGYAPQLDLEKHERDLDSVRSRLANLFPTDDELINYELARLLGMLEPFNAELLTKVLAKVTDQSHPANDIHHLLVAARIPTNRDGKQRESIAQALVGLDAKLLARKLHQDSSWEPRLTEIFEALIKHDPLLPETLAKQTGFGLPGHVLFLGQISGEQLPAAIDAFAKQAETQTDYQWSNDVVFVLGESTKPQHRELIREQFDNFGVRGAVSVVLAKNPVLADRAKFVTGLESPQTEVIDACLAALKALPASEQADDRANLVRCLRRLGATPAEYATREELVRVLQQSTQQNFGFQFGKAGHTPQPEVVQRWTDWVVKNHPEEAGRILGASETELKNLKGLLADVDWTLGDAEAGRKLFDQRACVQCHGGRQALGPNLSGVAGRFSRDDLFSAIVLPNRDVSSQYQTTVIVLNSGKVHTGLIIYEAVDGVLLRNSANQTLRIETRDIDFQRKLPQSLMPAGLLKDLQGQQLADLYAYLKSLK